MEGREGRTVISHRCMTGSNFKQKRPIFRQTVSAFLQQVVASYADAPPGGMHDEPKGRLQSSFQGYKKIGIKSNYGNNQI